MRGTDQQYLILVHNLSGTGEDQAGSARIGVEVPPITNEVICISLDLAESSDNKAFFDMLRAGDIAGGFTSFKCDDSVRRYLIIFKHNALCGQLMILDVLEGFEPRVVKIDWGYLGRNISLLDDPELTIPEKTSLRS